MTVPGSQDRQRDEPDGQVMPLLRVRDLSVWFLATDGTVPAVDGVSFSVRRGQAVGIVGESGAGKSASVLALLGLLPAATRVHGSIEFDGQELIGLSQREWQRLRGRRMAMAFTESVTALDPVRSVGEHLVEAVRAHRMVNRREAVTESARALEAAGLAASRDLLRSHPHQLSGGMRQRVMIAMAVVNEPELIVLDEPISSLDMCVRARLVRTLAGVRDGSDVAIVLVTHDLGVAAALCDRILVMRAGRIVEAGSTQQVLRTPRAPYTVGLLRAAGQVPVADIGQDASRADGSEREESSLLEVTDLVVRYPKRETSWWPRATERFTAVAGVCLTLHYGESLGLVGESGAGKTSLVRAILQLRRPEAGSVRLAGQELTSLSRRQLRGVRARLQVVLQDPFASLDPRMSVGAIVAEPLRIHRRWRHGGPERVRELMSRVGLDPGHTDRYPHEFSAGQRQRIALARALVLEPQILVLDEPVSALDVSIRAEILALLAVLRDSFGLAYLVISHDLSAVRKLCDRVVVMRQGRIVESGPVAQVFSHPSHPYTEELLRSIPSSCSGSIVEDMQWGEEGRSMRDAGFDR